MIEIKKGLTRGKRCDIIKNKCEQARDALK